MYYVSMHSFRSGKFSISLIQALTSCASTKAFSFEIDTRLKLLRFCVVLLILEIRQMEFYATVHEQCLTQKKKKNLSLGVRLENRRNKKCFHCCCFKLGE